MTAERSLVVLGLGEVLWDLLPDGRQLGGAVANVAFHARQLGADGCVVSAVGGDALGRDLLARMAELGLPTDSVPIDVIHPTGTVTVELTAGQPTYTIHENVAWDFIPCRDDLRGRFLSADAVCFGTLAQRGEVWRETIRLCLAAVPDACLRVFDVNLRQDYYDEEVLRTSLDLADVCKLNDEELPILAESLGLADGPAETLCTALLDEFDLQCVALTRGQHGSTLYRPGQPPHTMAGEPVDLVDAVGAGDAFTAALIVGLLRDEPTDALHARAAQLAGYVCTQPGATPTPPAEFLT